MSNGNKIKPPPRPTPVPPKEGPRTNTDRPRYIDRGPSPKNEPTSSGGPRVIPEKK
jgi:hypothetical protein